MRSLKDVLGSNMKFVLVVSKINDSTSFKDNNKRQGSVAVKVRIGDNMAVHSISHFPNQKVSSSVLL